MTPPRPLSESDLHAYADGQLPPDRVVEVEAALARDPESAARIASIRKQNAELAKALDPWLEEPVPERLLEAAMPPSADRVAGVQGRRSALHAWRPAAALAATLVVGIAIGWIGRESLLVSHGVPTTFAREAAFSHAIYARDQGRPVEVGAQEEARLVRWLARRLGIEVPPPDLASTGFLLVGGRLVASNEKPTALLMYENPQKQRLTLQWRKSGPNANEFAFRYAEENGVGVFYWVDANCAYALSGDVDRTRLLEVARIVHAKLEEGYAQHLQR
jgi:anti-sigma factor RsiW